MLHVQRHGREHQPGSFVCRWCGAFSGTLLKNSQSSFRDAAISAFTRVFDALWRRARNDGRGEMASFSIQILYGCVDGLVRKVQYVSRPLCQESSPRALAA